MKKTILLLLLFIFPFSLFKSNNSTLEQRDDLQANKNYNTKYPLKNKIMQGNDYYAKWKNKIITKGESYLVWQNNQWETKTVTQEKKRAYSFEWKIIPKN